MRRRITLALAGAAAFVLVAQPALAHVTVQPNEAVAGSFPRFVVRVPNERDDAAPPGSRCSCPTRSSR